jgi:hypothetical protein
MDQMKKAPMRVGILCNGIQLEAWQARCIEYLWATGDVEIALLILDDSGLGPRFFDRLKQGDLGYALKRVFNGDLLYRLYHRFLFRPRSTQLADLSHMLAKVPVVSCKVIRKGKFSQYFSEEDLQTIRSYDLDFVLRFAFGIIRGEILKVPRYGVWSFHHDDEQKYRGGPPCFWEVYYGDPVTGGILQRLTDKLDGGIVLKKGYLGTIHHSYARNLDQMYFESARWPAQVVAEIRFGHAEYLSAPPSSTTANIFLSPRNRHMLAFALKWLRSSAAVLWKDFFRHEQWSIGIARRPIHEFLNPETQPAVEFLPQPDRTKFQADSFGIWRGHRVIGLCESFDYRAAKGVIQTFEYTGSSADLDQSVAFELPVHASYPFLVEASGELYCIPETSAAREVAIYRAVEFPHKWEKAATLLHDVAALDSTVFRHEGQWWLLCTYFEQGSLHNLFAWHAEHLFGPWVPHPLNPVKTDIRSSRPAGTPFYYDGNLYRPSQDCSESYGKRIVFNRVLILTRDQFAEEPVTVLNPFGESPFPDGIHTIAAAGPVTFVDGKRYVFVPAEFARMLRRRLQRIGKRFST